MQLVLDVAALLVFASVTFSMASTVGHLHTWQVKTFALVVLAGAVYFLVRGALNLWRTVADRASGRFAGSAAPELTKHKP